MADAQATDAVPKETPAAPPSAEGTEDVNAAVTNLLANLKKKKKKKPKSSDAKKAAAATESEGQTLIDTGDEYPYQQILERVYKQLRENNPDLVNKKRAVLRPPQVMRVGTSKILWVNFPEICKMMKRDPEHVFRFFLAELGTTGSIDGNQRFMIKGKYVPKVIESLLKKYISEYVTCHMCRGVETKLVRDPVSRMYFMHCDSCGASRAVAAIQKGYHATARGERRAARLTN